MNKEILRKVQLTQLELLKEFSRICEENHLRYTLEAGTLLGAVRHGGFIPWDDDVDVSMPREDYDRFFAIASEMKNSDFIPVRWDLTEGYPHPFGKFVKKGTVYKEEKMDTSFGIYIDVFPWDCLPDGFYARKLYKYKLMTIRAIMRAKCGCRTYRTNNKIIISKLLKNLPFIVLSYFFKTDTLINAYDSIAKKNNREITKKIVLQDDTSIGDWSTNIQIFDKQQSAVFEDSLFSIPKEYDAYLREVYGDYLQLPPESERENRHLIVEIDFGED